jgi:hypothetical protein
MHAAIEAVQHTTHDDDVLPGAKSRGQRQRSQTHVCREPYLTASILKGSSSQRPALNLRKMRAITHSTVLLYD